MRRQGIDSLKEYQPLNDDHEACARHETWHYHSVRVVQRRPLPKRPKHDEGRCPFIIVSEAVAFCLLLHSLTQRVTDGAEHARSYDFYHQRMSVQHRNKTVESTGCFVRNERRHFDLMSKCKRLFFAPTITTQLLGFA